MSHWEATLEQTHKLLEGCYILDLGIHLGPRCDLVNITKVCQGLFPRDVVLIGLQMPVSGRRWR